jgi:formate dehydrogenase iron-sulfur subunit
MNVVVFAMDLRGPAPQLAPQGYFPSVVEWGISVGLGAATIFLFGLAVRLMPVLSRDEADLSGTHDHPQRRKAA